MSHKEIIKKLTLEEKASLLVGYANMSTFPLLEKGIPPLIMSDGPHGIRKENSEPVDIENPFARTLPATCFPTGITLANTFDNQLLYKVGKQIALECCYYGINAILGPAINIKRNPLCGRNFEYYSEDPILAGYLSANYIKGLQEEHVLACVKHYACNNLEKWRYVGDSVVDLRALNDVYLKPYEISIRESNPGMLMTSYNRINGTFASENEYLINDRLRKKMNYQGLTVTDWGGMVNRDISLNAGQDIEMPGRIVENKQKIIDGVNSGLIKMETVDESIERLLSAIDKTHVDKIKDEEVFLKSKDVALEAALKGAVLLKNEHNILPLDKNKKYVIIGDLFKNTRFQGSGSSLVTTKYLITNDGALNNHHIQYAYAQGYDQMSPKINKKLKDEALLLSKESDIVLFFGGLIDISESEGFDRDNMLLDENQVDLIKELVKLNKKIVFVMYGGSPFEIPELDKIDACLFMSLPGECGGEAMYQLLFGEISPSGHLCETWMKKYSDVPYSDDFTKTPIELYKESIFVGYRYFNTVNKEVLFPFGYGLSYGKYSFSKLSAKVSGDNIDVTFEVLNESDISLSACAQLYVGKVNSSVPRPKKELKAYTRIDLKPNDKQTVKVSIKVADLAIYDRKTTKDVVEDGEYVIYLSYDVENDAESVSVNIKGEKLECLEEEKIYLDPSRIDNISTEEFEKLIGRKIPPYAPAKKPYTLETPICEFNSFFGKIIKSTMIRIGKKIIRNSKKIKDEKEQRRQFKDGVFIKKMITSNCLRSLCYSSSGGLPYNKALGILYLANGHPFKARKYFKKAKNKD